MFGSIHQLQKTIYLWRQRRPLKRLGMVALLLVVLPVRLVVFALLNILSRRGEPRRILVMQFAGLGDALMLTPALAALHQKYPKAKIDFVTLHDYVKEAFHAHPRFDSIATLGAYPGQWIVPRIVKRTGLTVVLSAIWYYPELLLSRAFSRSDIGINFGIAEFDTSLGNALLRLLNVPRRVGMAGRNDTLLTDCPAVDVTHTHRARAYMDFLKPLGISATNFAYEFPVPGKDLLKTKQTLRRAQIDPSKRLAVIHPGGKLHINSRRWPAEYYARVCESLTLEHGFEVVLTGDRHDVPVCDEILSGSKSQIKSIAGHLSFSETAALLSDCDLCITNDTSILHLADAVQVPRVISIFGPTDPDLLAPQNQRSVVFRSDLPCAPCMGGLIDANSERCGREVKEECLMAITPEQVNRALEHYYGNLAVRVAGAS